MPEDPQDPFSSESVGRLLNEVQQFGLTAAGDVIGRFSRLAADEAGRVGRTATLRSDIGEWVELTQQSWTSMFEATLGAGGPLAQTMSSVVDAAGGSSNRRSHSTGADDAVKAAPVAPGSHTTAEVWVHNMVAAELTVASVQVGEFRSGTGELLTGVDVSVDPERLPLVVSSGASACVPIRLDVPPTAPAGRWHALVFVAPDGGAPIALTLDITEARPR